MHNKVINLALVAQVAQGLQELREKMVFIGGAVISLYTDDPAAEEIRPTTDIDMTINLANYAEWAQMQERLAELEFFPDPQGQSICSYKFQDIAIDIMPAEDSNIGISNIWYKPGFKYMQQIALEDGTSINILPSPYFLATKLEAFKDRGQNDFYGSHDFVHSQGVNSYFKKDYRRAIDLISSSLPTLSGKDDFANVAVGNFYIGKSLFALGREPEAIAYMQKVYAAFLKHKYVRPDLREAFEILIDHYKKKGELKLQLRHIETLLAADRIIAEEQAYMSQKIHKEYDTNELNREKIRIEKQLRDRNYAIYFITSISFFTIACLVYRHAANKKFYDKRYAEIMHPVPADDKNTGEVFKEDKSEHTDDVESDRPYLPQDVIDDILDKLDYFESEKIFLDSSLGLEELEKMFGYNRRYISLVIQNEKKLTFLPYLNSLKIMNITALLRTETRLRKYTTSGLAEESGFTSGKIFSKTFKKINKIPHLEFIARRNAEDEAEQRSLSLEKDNTPEGKE